ncbi:hypothetical protein Tco_1248524 [Tanacetum coccineum]
MFSLGFNSCYGNKANDLILDMYDSVASTNGKMACMLRCVRSLVVSLISQSPEGFVTALIAKTSTEAFTQLPRMGAREVGGGKRVCLGRIGGGSKITGCSGRVKDYVMECIGSEIKQRPKSEWITAGASSSAVQTCKSEMNKSKKRSDWWMSLDEEKNVKEPKRRPAREWWKEEYCDELARKKKKNMKKQGRESSTHNLNNNNWWQKYDMYIDNRKKKRSRSTSRGRRGSAD